LDGLLAIRQLARLPIVIRHDEDPNELCVGRRHRLLEYSGGGRRQKREQDEMVKTHLVILRPSGGVVNPRARCVGLRRQVRGTTHFSRRPRPSPPP
jgi:hypothetical protein